MKKNTVFWISIGLGVVLFVLSLFNIIGVIASDSFFKVNASNVLTSTMVIIGTFVVSRKDTEDRQKKEAVLKMLMKIEDLLTTEIITEIPYTDKTDVSKCLEKVWSKLTMSHRKLNNYIDYLKKAKEKYLLISDIDYLAERAVTYADAWAEKPSDLLQISVINNTMPREVDLMHSKVLKMQMDVNFGIDK